MKAFLRRHWKLCILLLLLVVAYHGMKWYGRYGALQLEVNHLSMPAETLPGAGPLRIAFLADVHDSRELLDEALDAIEQAKPDLIIFGGDLIMVNTRFMRTRRMVQALRRMKSIAPTFAILGNQDYEKQEQVERVYRTAGIPLLRNQSVEWQSPAGHRLRIVGLGDYNEGDEAPEQCMAGQAADDVPVLLLSHDPESRELLADYHWHLMLSGHTHGGQLGVPFTEPRRFISLRSDMPAGLYSFDRGRRIFVTRGVGSTMGMRFFCPPEVNIIDIGR